MGPAKKDWEKYDAKSAKEKDVIKVLDEGDIAILKTYGQGAYAKELKTIEKDVRDVQRRVNEKMGVKESDTGLAPPNLWDLPADKQKMGEQHPLQVFTYLSRLHDAQKSLLRARVAMQSIPCVIKVILCIT